MCRKILFLSVFILLNHDSRAETTATGAKGNVFLPDISAIGTLSGAYFTKDPGVNGHDPSRTGFNLQEIEMGIQSVIDPYVRGDIFLAFHEEGVEVEEGYLTTLALPANLQIRAGKMKLPFGRQNQKHLEKWAFVNDPLITSQIFGGEGLNELGVVGSWLIPVPFFLQLEGAVSQGENAKNFDSANKNDMAYLGRLSTSGNLTRHLTLLSGVSAVTGMNDTGSDHHTSVVGGDVTLKWKGAHDHGWQFENEYLMRHRQLLIRTEKDGGLVSQLLVEWNKRWQTGVRFDLTGLPKDHQQDYRISPMVGYHPSEFFGLKTQYDYQKPDHQKEIHAVYLQATFSMGPHGVHSF